MGRLRAFVKDDNPRVAQLYWQFLQSQKGPYPPAIGVHGWLEIRYAQELSEARCSFWGSIPLLFRACDPELARLVQHGDTFFSRLDGEWCLKHDGRGHGRPIVRLDLANGKESSSETPARLRPKNSHPSQPPQAKAAK